MIRKSLVFIFIFFSIINIISAQEMLNPKQNFLYDGKYFDPYSPYVTVGAGYGYNTAQNNGEQNLTVDFYTYFKDIGFNVGYLASSDRFLEGTGGLKQYESRQRLHNFHFGAGYRHERLRHNFGIYAGGAYAAGRTPTDTLTNASAYIVRREPGLYLQAHYSRKPAYDVGYGVSFYVAFSRNFKIIGVQAHIFLSSAFKAYNR